MSGNQSHVAVFAVLVAVVGSAVAGGALAPVGAVAAQETNGTDADPGAVVASGVDAGGQSVGTPVEAGDAAFDGAFYARLSAVSTAYNEERPDLGFGGGLVTGNVVNLHVTDGDEEAVVSFRVTGDNRITDLRAGARGDAAIRMTTDRATFDRIAAADAPGEAFARALESGDVRIEGRGPLGGLTWAAVNLVRDLLALF